VEREDRALATACTRTRAKAACAGNAERWNKLALSKIICIFHVK